MTLTPEQFNLLATKEDLKNFVTKEDLREVKNDILSAIDGLAKEVKDMKEEQVFNIAAHDRFEERITRVEKKLNLNPATS